MMKMSEKHMEKKNRTVPDVLSTEQIERELRREQYRKDYRQVLKNTVGGLITVAATAVLVAVLLLPVLRIFGRSMSPTLREGDIVLSLKTADFTTGDVVAFYYNNKILVKRVIASSGDWVDLDEDGTVYVNKQRIEEPYLTERAYGETNIELPFQVPESRIFVMGDNRAVSVDSRNTAVGCVSEEQVVGKIVFRVWPLQDIGPVGSGI